MKGSGVSTTVGPRSVAISVGVILAIVLPLAAPGAWADGPIVTRFIDEDTNRVPIETVVPIYPRTARRDRVEGEVQVCYHIDRKGRPYRVAVRHSTHRVFERPAKLAVKASRYKPLGDGEKTSGIKTCRTFRFELAPMVAENGDG